MFRMSGNTRVGKSAVDRVIDTEVPILPDRLIEMFLPHRPYLSWSGRLEGSTIDRGRLVLGMRAGPNISINHLLHEMAHLVEIDDERCFAPSWGLRGKEFPRTFQATEREMRVGAIQIVLGDIVGVPQPSSYVATAWHFLPDWHMWRLWRDVAESEVAPAMALEIERQARLLTKQGVLSEWARKCRILGEKAKARARAQFQ